MRAHVSHCGIVVCVGCLAAAGCSQPDHRLSLGEFMSMEESSKQATAARIEQMPPRAIDQQFAPYTIGPGDVLRVTLTTTAQPVPFPPALIRVNRDGALTLPVVGDVHIGGMELEDAENTVRTAYVPRVFGEAVIHLEVMYADMTQVLVTGAVTLPGFVQLKRTDRNMLHAIVGAGGLSQAGGKATLRRVRNPIEEQTFDLTDPVQISEALALPPLEDGDVIRVHSAPLNTIYVGGLVNRPAPLPLPPGVQLTALQAIAGASGVRTDITPSEVTLIRRQPDGSDVHVRLDLERMVRGEEPNIVLAAGDILWVPETLETKVQDWINRNIFMRAGISVTYSVTGIEFMNRHELQGQNVSGTSNLENTFDPLGFLGRNQILQDLESRPLVP